MDHREEEGSSDNDIRCCPICRCTEHRLVGCGRHWSKHKVGPDGRCQPR